MRRLVNVGAGPRPGLVLGLAALGLLALAACRSDAGPSAPPEVRLATDLPPATVEQALRSVAARGGPRAVPVAARPADASAEARWDIGPTEAIAAAARGELAPAPAAAADVPALWRDPGGTWVAVGGRAQVLLVAVDRLQGHGLPVRFTALTETWLKGKVALAAPTSGAALAHFAALYEAWGQERMELWLSQLAQNQVRVLADDAAVHQAVASGAAVVGLLGSDEAARAKASAAPVEVVYPNQRSIGVFVWPTALYRPKSGRRDDKGAALLEQLASAEVEQLLVAREPGFLPLRKNIPVPPGVQGAANLVVLAVPPARISAQLDQRRAALAAWAKENRRD